MPVRVRFDGPADIVGSPPDPARWRPAPSGVATAGLKLGKSALVREDGEGRYLGAGLPLLCAGDLLPDGPTARVEVRLDLGPKVPACRVILPLADLLAGGGKADTSLDVLSESDLQYVYVEVKKSSGDLILSAYITDPFANLGAGSLSDALIARRSIVGGAAPGSGVLVVEAGPRFVRAWWGADWFSRRAPDLGCAIPWIDLDQWGCMCQDAKIREVRLTTPIEAPDEDAYAAVAVPDQEPAPESPSPRSTRDYSRPVDLRYLAPPHVRRRRACLMLRSQGPGHTGRLADSFYRRLDAEQTLIYVGNGEVQSLDVSSLGEYLSGEASDPLQISTEVDAVDGPAVGIGSGRSSMDDGGELALNLPLPREDAEYLYRQQTAMGDMGGIKAILQSSSRPGHQWKFSVNVHPKHLRRAERLVALAGGARSFWAFPPLGPRQIPAFTRALSHEIAGPKRSTLQLDLEES